MIKMHDDTIARYIRLIPKDWYDHISLRWGFLGIKIPESEIPKLSTQFEESLILQKPLIEQNQKREDDDIAKIIDFTKNIPNSQFIASSEWDYENRSHASYHSRLTEIQSQGASAWCSAECDLNQWLQADLGKNHFIKILAIQGRADYRQFIKEFQLGVSSTGDRFEKINGGQIFDGSYRIKLYYLPERIIGRYIRIYPISWEGHISLRWGFCGIPCE